MYVKNTYTVLCILVDVDLFQIGDLLVKCICLDVYEKYLIVKMRLGTFDNWRNS